MINVPLKAGASVHAGGRNAGGSETEKRGVAELQVPHVAALSLSLSLSRSLSSPLKHLSGQVIAKLRRCGEQKGRQKLLCVMLISWGRMFMGMFKGMIMLYVACNSLGRKVPNPSLGFIGVFWGL